MQPKDRIVLAVDTPDLAAARALAAQVAGEVGLLKLGLELFVGEGPEAVRALAAEGLGLFLDLKLHDIPNTVGAAARAAGRLGVRMLTVHASGGAAMVRAAVDGAGQGAREAGVEAPIVLGVTVLTSLGEADLAAVGLAGPSEAAVVRLARLAVEAGAGGLVCSPAEVAAVRAAVGPGITLVTPGVRPAGSAVGDQARVATPAAAIAAGADYLVVGRPIRAAEDPAAAARAIAAEIADA